MKHDVDHDLVILILGPGDPAGTLPDPGEEGFAIEPLHPDSLSVTEQDDALWIEGQACAFRGTPPPHAQGFVTVYPDGLFGWPAPNTEGVWGERVPFTFASVAPDGRISRLMALVREDSTFTLRFVLALAR